MTTIRDVAALAGVSPATVSLVINNNPRIAEQTAQRVNDAIAQLKYVPQKTGRPSRSKSGRRKQRTITFVSSSSFIHSQSQMVYMQLLDGVNQYLESQQCNSQFVCVGPDESIPENLLNSDTQGFILLGPELVPKMLQTQTAIPFVQVMGAILGDETWDHITGNNELVGKLAADYLAAHNHTHIAVLDCGKANQVYYDRSHAFERYAKKTGAMTYRTDRMVFNREGDLLTPITHALHKIKTIKPPPTALFVPADMLAAAAYPALSSLKLKPGKDIIVISGNNEKVYFTGLNPQPITVNTQAPEVGRLGAQRLLERIANPNMPYCTQVVSPTLDLYFSKSPHKKKPRL